MARRVLLTARAIATGVVVTLLFRVIVEIPMAAAADRWGSSSWFARWLVATAPGMLAPAAALVAGWSVAHFHREHRFAMVMSYALFVVVMALPRVYALVTSVVADRRYVPYLLTHLVNVALVAGAVLVGGQLRGLTPDAMKPGSDSDDEAGVRPGQLTP